MYANSSPGIPHRQPDPYQQSCVDTESSVWPITARRDWGGRCSLCIIYPSKRDFYLKKTLQICTIRSERHCSEICGKPTSIRPEQTLLCTAKIHVAAARELTAVLTTPLKMLRRTVTFSLGKKRGKCLPFLGELGELGSGKKFHSFS